MHHRRTNTTARGGRRRTVPGTVLVAAAALTAAGCGGDIVPTAQQPAPTVTVTVTETASPSAAPTPSEPAAVSRREAGRIYEDMFAPWNSTARDIDTELESSAPALPELTRLAARMARLNKDVLRTIQDTAWPTEVRRDMRSLYRETSTFQGLFDAMAERAESVDEYYGIYMTVVRKSHTGTATRIRMALGID